METSIRQLIDNLLDELRYQWQELHNERCNIVDCDYSTECNHRKPKILEEADSILPKCEFCLVRPRLPDNKGHKPLYCSTKCRSAAFRKRKKEAV